VVSKEKDKKKRAKMFKLLRNVKFQRTIIGVITLVLAFFIVEAVQHRKNMI